jgi:tetraacyldisaccharide 4'-kinase
VTDVLQRTWWASQPTLLAWLLWPISSLYRALFALKKASTSAKALPLPVIVVGNLIVGGAGKTPTVVALVRALQSAGWRPGVISRGHGGQGDAPRAVADHAAAIVGDEPALIARLTGVPVWVGRQRVIVARQLTAAHADVNIIVSDDGLQHAALARSLEVLVFDERGVGNGLCLPAGPLREPMWHTLTPKANVLYNASQASTALPGHLLTRRLGAALALADWARGDVQRSLPLTHFAGRPCLAAAGIAAPERFFTMLEAAGLHITRLPLPDHHGYAQLPWPADTPDVLVTEKDAIKLVQLPAALNPSPDVTRIWVVGLDFVLPAAFLHWLHQSLPSPTPTP